MRRESSMKKEDKLISFIKALSLGVICAVILYTLLLLLCSLAFCRIGDIPQSFIGPITMTIAGIGAFVGGIVSAKKSKEKGMVNGMICAFVLFVIIFIGSLVVAHEPFSMGSLVKSTLMLLFGAIGGIIGVNKK